MEVSVGIAILSGLFSTLSPCILPILPAFLAWVSGIELDEKRHRRIKVFYHLSWFNLGLIVMFVMSGAAAGWLGEILYDLMWITQAAGVLFIIWGLFLMNIISFPKLNIRPPNPRQVGYLGAFGFGVVYAMVWTPCIGPIYGTILTLAASSGTAFKGAMLLLAYSIGLTIPLMLVGLGTDTLIRHVKKIAKYEKYVRYLTGIVIVLAGILLASSKYNLVIGHILELFPSYTPPLA
jgi:cytochrome c-type biogenesis protein